MKNKWKFFSDNRTFIHILYISFIPNRKSKFAFKTAGFVKQHIGYFLWFCRSNKCLNIDRKTDGTTSDIHKLVTGAKRKYCNVKTQQLQREKTSTNLLENGISELRMTLDLFLSRLMLSLKLLVLPSTLMRSVRNFSCIESWHGVREESPNPDQGKPALVQTREVSPSPDKYG